MQLPGSLHVLRTYYAVQYSHSPPKEEHRYCCSENAIRILVRRMLVALLIITDDLQKETRLKRFFQVVVSCFF